jgi:hypothetical protein
MIATTNDKEEEEQAEAEADEARTRRGDANNQVYNSLTSGNT